MPLPLHLILTTFTLLEIKIVSRQYWSNILARFQWPLCHVLSSMMINLMDHALADHFVVWNIFRIFIYFVIQIKGNQGFSETCIVL